MTLEMRSARRTEEGDGARAAVRAGAERGCEADEAAARQRCGEARRGGERGGGGCGSGHEGSEGGDGRWGGVGEGEGEPARKPFIEDGVGGLARLVWLPAVCLLWQLRWRRMASGGTPRRWMADQGNTLQLQHTQSPRPFSVRESATSVIAGPAQGSMNELAATAMAGDGKFIS